jgi:hypothetical protein
LDNIRKLDNTISNLSQKNNSIAEFHRKNTRRSNSFDGLKKFEEKFQNKKKDTVKTPNQTILRLKKKKILKLKISKQQEEA